MRASLAGDARFQSALDGVSGQVVRAVIQARVEEDLSLGEAGGGQRLEVAAIHSAEILRYGPAVGDRAEIRAGIRSPWTIRSEISSRSRASCWSSASGSQSMRMAESAS